MSQSLPRICHTGLHGPDVRAYSRVMRRVQIRLRPETDFFGLYLAKNIKHFQDDSHLPVTGVVDQATFRQIEKHFDNYDRWLISKTVQIPSIPTPRQLVVGQALAMYAHRPFPYREVRPYPDDLAQLLADGSDCSGTFHLAYKEAHHFAPSIPDPSGFDFDGYGNTVTMLQHGSKTTIVRPGDAAFYYADFGHVGIYLGGGKVFSHGKPGDPVIIPSSGATQFRTYL